MLPIRSILDLPIRRIVKVESSAPKAGLAFTIRVSRSRLEEPSARQAPWRSALDLEWLRNGALPPAAPDRSFGEHPHGGPWSRVFVTGCGGKAIALRLPEAGPSASAGLRTRPVSGNRATGTISVPRQPNLPSQAHPGLTCLGPCETVCLPPSPSCPCNPQPERYLIRLL